MHPTKFAGILAAGLFFSTTAHATAVVHVDESGEGGGAMSLSLDTPTVKAGKVMFEVKNSAISEEHEMVLVKLKSKDEAIPFSAAKHRVDEAKLKSLGEVSDLKPAGTGKLAVNLKPGDYLLFCNIKGHYEAGMKGYLTVTK